MSKLMSDNESQSSDSSSSSSEEEIEQPKIVKPKKVKEEKVFVPDVPPEKPKKRVYTKKAQTAEEADLAKQKRIDNLAKARAKRKENLEAKKKEKQEVNVSPPSVEKVISKPLKEKKQKKEKVVKNYITNNYIAPAAEEQKKPKPKAQRILIPKPFQFI